MRFIGYLSPDSRQIAAIECRRWGILVQPVSVTAFLERVDPGTHRRIKGLRLVVAFAFAWMMGALYASEHRGLSGGGSLGAMAGAFALWASVSEGRATRAASARDLCFLVIASAIGAAAMVILAPTLAAVTHVGPELTLAGGAFLVGVLRRYDVLGAGIGSQVFIGQLLAYGSRPGTTDLPMIAVAGAIAAIASVVPRLLSGPAEHPVSVISVSASQAWKMGVQGVAAALVIVAANAALALEQSAWAITASTYVIAGTASGTFDRVRRRIAGTAVGVPLALAALPIALEWPLLVELAAALAMIVYAMALPERYDIACGAYAFALIVTLVASGDDSLPMLLSRAWETVLGGAVGLAAALSIFPLRDKAGTPGRTN